jgi:hypothetical protein
MKAAKHITATFGVAFASLLLLTAFTDDPATNPVPSPPASIPKDNLIVPKVRIGGVALGMTMAQLYAAMGDPTRSISSETGGQYSYGTSNGPLGSAWIILTNAQGQVYQIGMTLSQYATASGIAVGNSPLRVQALLGAPCSVAHQGTGAALIYPGLELWYDVTAGGNINEITVSTQLICEHLAAGD